MSQDRPEPALVDLPLGHAFVVAPYAAGSDTCSVCWQTESAHRPASKRGWSCVDSNAPPPAPAQGSPDKFGLHCEDCVHQGAARGNDCDCVCHRPPDKYEAMALRTAADIRDRMHKPLARGVDPTRDPLCLLLLALLRSVAQEAYQLGHDDCFRDFVADSWRKRPYDR